MGGLQTAQKGEQRGDTVKQGVAAHSLSLITFPRPLDVSVTVAVSPHAPHATRSSHTMTDPFFSEELNQGDADQEEEFDVTELSLDKEGECVLQQNKAHDMTD